MPELPEVETTRLGITPHIVQHKVIRVIVRHKQLRWPISDDLTTELPQQTIHSVTRRGKYLLLQANRGAVILHLGMSGRLRILPANHLAEKHDHVDIIFDNNLCLRFTDPRRFGAIIWTRDNPLHHPLLIKLGEEPLAENFTGKFLYQRSRQRKTSIKQFIMDSHIVVGVGNIYANEALFAAGINPKTAAGHISQNNYRRLVHSIKQVLLAAIAQGGTTLRDFRSSDGKPGYFIQELKVYGKAGMPCVNCKTKLKEIRLGQRSTVYCPKCQN